MTNHEALTWLRHARWACRLELDAADSAVCTVARSSVYRGGEPARRAMAHAYTLRAIACYRTVVEGAQGRELWLREARVLAFCAAVLRATLPEEADEGPGEVERLHAWLDELGVERERVDMRGGKTSWSLRDRVVLRFDELEADRDDARRIAEEHRRRADDAAARVKELEGEVARLRSGAWLPSVEDVSHSWDDAATVSEILGVVRSRLGGAS